MKLTYGTAQDSTGSYFDYEKRETENKYFDYCENKYKTHKSVQYVSILFRVHALTLDELKIKMGRF